MGTKMKRECWGRERGGGGEAVIETAFSDNDNFQVIVYCARHLQLSVLAFDMSAAVFLVHTECFVNGLK